MSDLTLTSKVAVTSQAWRANVVHVIFWSHEEGSTVISKVEATLQLNALLKTGSVLQKRSHQLQLEDRSANRYFDVLTGHLNTASPPFAEVNLETFLHNEEGGVIL